MNSPFVTPAYPNHVIFCLCDTDVKSTLDGLGIEELSTGRMTDLLHFVGDRFDNMAPEDIADAIMDFFDLEVGGGV